MPDQNPSLLAEETRSNWVRLRTLIVLRWLAIAGQLVTVTLVQRFFDLDLNLGLCYLAIGVSVIANLFAIFIYPENKRLSETEVLLTLLFDLSQLVFLLFLTGGLNNPFTLLVLAPVTISATALRLRSTVVVGFAAIASVTFLMYFHMPLRTQLGAQLRMPTLFLIGAWASINIGVVFIAIYARRVSLEILSMSQALLATQMALSREQKLTDLGGVVAAAAHELGTPLATIKLVSSELMEELSDRPEQFEDAELIRDQADRCRDILRSMGRAGKDDLHLRQALLEAVIGEAAEPHSERGKRLVIDISPASDTSGEQPSIARRPEIIHGLRNLIQNAVDFAETTVWIDANWSDETVEIRIIDDGPGFPSHLLGRIGDPFVGRRRTEQERAERPGYEGMGLGLFIAKTLLERSGAELNFDNAGDPGIAQSSAGTRKGAIVEVVWPRNAITTQGRQGEGLGENRPFEA